VPPAGTAPRGDDDDDADVAAVVVVDGDTAPLPTATAALLLDLLEPHPMIFPFSESSERDQTDLHLAGKNPL
jgi:hypothetical protein